MSEIIKSLFDSVLREYLKSGPPKKNYGERLKKMAIVIQNLQFNTSNGKKKRKVEVIKVLDLPDELIIEVSLFVPYKTIFKLLQTNKNLKNILDKNAYSFWKRKFKSEFVYQYPKLLEKNLEKGYKYATKEFFKIKDNFWNLFKLEDIFESGNELLFILIIEIFRPDYRRLEKWIKYYIRKNVKLSTKFFIDVINYDSNTFNVIALTSKEYEKKRVFFAYLKNTRSKKTTKLLVKLYESKKLKDVFDDEDFLLKSTRVNGNMLKYLILFNVDYSRNEDVILKALETKANAFNYISLDLQKNREFILKALDINGWVFQYLLPEFKDDLNILKKAINYNEFVIQFASERLKNSEVVKNLILKEPELIEFAGSDLKNDIKLFKAIVKSPYNLYLLDHMGEALKNNLNFAKYVVNKTDEESALFYFDESIISMNPFYNPFK